MNPEKLQWLCMSMIVFPRVKQCFTSILACIARELRLPGTHIYTNPHSRPGFGRGRVKSKRGKQLVPTRIKAIQALEARFTLLICS
jgi:hypothetical protein